MKPTRPELPEAEYLVRQWMTQTWGDGRYGRVLRRLMSEYDRRGRVLAVLDPGGAMPDTDTPCHTGVRAKTCGRCQSLVERAAGDLAPAIGDVDQAEAAPPSPRTTPQH